MQYESNRTHLKKRNSSTELSGVSAVGQWRRNTRQTRGLIAIRRKQSRKVGKIVLNTR